jgi:hypothetical protein
MLSVFIQSRIPRPEGGQICNFHNLMVSEKRGPRVLDDFQFRAIPGSGEEKAAQASLSAYCRTSSGH